MEKNRFCLCCRLESPAFLPFGSPPRPDVLCPHCESLERHRLTMLFLQAETDLFDGKPKRLLHVAPEKCFRPVFEKIPHLDYLPADIDSKRGARRLDLRFLPQEDEYFDVVYASHVLEHIPEDRRAMREIFRVLKTGGWALLLVPCDFRGLTQEDLSIKSPEERLKHYGQADHVRLYGKDFPDRLREAGFSVRVETYGQSVTREEAEHWGLPLWERVFYCEKPR